MVGENAAKKGTKQFLCQDFFHTVYLIDGIITIGPSSRENGWNTHAAEFEELFRSCGYKQFQPSNACAMAMGFAGRPIEELKAELTRRGKDNAKHRQRFAEEQARWKQTQKELSGVVLGVAETDLYETGFTVWVLLNSSYTFKQQLGFVKAHKKAIYQFIQRELPHKKPGAKMMAQMLPYCRVSEITLTRRNELVVKYELKEEIQAVLKD